MNFGENRILQRQAYETSDYQFAAENLAYSYGEIEVFSNVSFSLSQGELAFLVGKTVQENQPCFDVLRVGRALQEARCF